MRSIVGEEKIARDSWNLPEETAFREAELPIHSEILNATYHCSKRTHVQNEHRNRIGIYLNDIVETFC